jgi:hypothetical protein
VRAKIGGGPPRSGGDVNQDEAAADSASGGAMSYYASLRPLGCAVFIYINPIRDVLARQLLPQLA